MYWICVVYFWFISGICNGFGFVFYVKMFWKKVIYLKLVLKCLKLRFEVGIYEISMQVLIYLSLNDFPWNFIFKKNRGKLPHDRDIAYHDRDMPSTSRALLGLTGSTFWFAHGLISRPWYHASRSWPWSRATITIVTCSEADAGVLTTVYHDRDIFLPARDIQKFLVFNWFTFGLFLSFLVAFSGVTTRFIANQLIN